MADKPPIVETNVIANIARKTSSRPARLSSKTSRVIPGEMVCWRGDTVKIVGGDTDDFAQDNPPAIILEKSGERIVKIVVKCSCGRHSELVCEYDDEELADVSAEDGGA